MKYAVVFEQARDGGWNAYVPDLPGCVSNGATIDDARKHVRQAIRGHLTALDLLREPLPAPASVAELVDV